MTSPPCMLNVNFLHLSISAIASPFRFFVLLTPRVQPLLAYSADTSSPLPLRVKDH
jgi:hypothetical protein